MRFRHPDGSTVHLAYCTNVHPAETLDGVLAQLRDHCEPVRRLLALDHPRTHHCMSAVEHRQRLVGLPDITFVTVAPGRGVEQAWPDQGDGVRPPRHGT